MFPDTDTVTVVASCLGPDGLPLEGWIYFESTEEQITYQGTVLVRSKARGAVSEGGIVRVQLLDPNASGVSPTGWNYKVTEAFHGCDTVVYTVSIPSGTEPDERLQLGELPRVT